MLVETNDEKGNKAFPFCLPSRNQEGGTNEREVMYTGGLTKQVKNLKAFSFATSIAGITIQPIIFQKFHEIGFGASLSMAGIVGFFTFVTPYLIHTVTKRYVTEMIYDPTTDTYTAKTISFFLRKKEMTFTARDIEVPDVPGMFTTIKVHKKPLLLTPDGFYSKKQYLRIMKLDVPLDFEIEEGKGEKKEST
ncbi:hypothetical protein QYM36_004688 [Artemia franciscana]|uniref:Transmembrane protein 70 n=1 Tax=Artemia franciscana TaxID=6661 RepID=A0AA88LCA1_ARTSF|nr:hypothetical protein QYM36_004688 [Artemia franciscana]